MGTLRPGFVHSPAYEMDIGAHVFITSKFRRYREASEREGLLQPHEVEAPHAADDAELLAVLEAEYLADLRGYRHTARTRRSELPLSREIVEGCVLCAGGSILAVRRAVERGCAIHFGGGYHHGFAGHAEGFCYINDAAIAAAVALRRGWASRVAVIDTDVHQGNGTARIFAGEDRVFTFSIHQENLYPMKERSDLDIGLADECGTSVYLRELERGLRVVLDQFQPDLALYLGGVDPYEHDRLGGVGVTMEGMAERERLVLGALAEHGIPFATFTAGGYALDPDDTVRLHVLTARAALEAFERDGHRLQRRAAE
ncbi:MAG: histone deacetylase [Candidatus Sumerlaeia bacterium]|nr:histone deacetylase [Candidatus Sumerlaeia bacterium]